MRQHHRLAVAGVALTAGFGLLSTPALATPTHASHASPIVGYSYVNDNPAGPNTIAAFARHADGSLSALRGSPFSVGGKGLGAGLGSQGSIQTSPDGRYLLAVDAGSNQISVARIGAHGKPRPVGEPVSSGGVEPVSIAINRRGLVYVANVGNGGSNYSAFLLGGDGRLTPLPRATTPVPEGSGVGDVLFNSTGDRLVGTRDNPSLIDSFRVRRDGTLKPAPGSPFAAQDLGPIGAAFRPTNPNELYVSNAHAGAGLGTVSAFRVSRRGVLSSIGHSPVADLQTAPCWVEITKDGKYLFAVNTGSGNLSRYRIERHGSLELLGTTAFKNGTGAVDARLSPDGRYLSVTGGRGLVVSTFAVKGGDLTELSSSPVTLPSGTSPTGLAVV